ncbi:MAG: MFS transporter [SAR202 cluster bacterium]|nr:MFS transporter [SAR202 cluster bacterium]MQG69349.1 MFS transporter [SAR202 cluster bacterium]HAL46588.1 hypothetical protein [Dehalococcoidia bacterium]
MSSIDFSLDHYRQVFRYRAFRLFWSGFALSVAGDAMTRVVLTWYVWEATGSSRALGLLAFLYTGPIIVSGLFAGALLDRFDRRRVMIVDSVVRGAAVAAIPLLHALGSLEVWHVYVVAAIYASLMMVSLAGAPTMIPSLVPERHLSTANALETIAYTLSGVLGPPIAGLLIAKIGAPNVVIIDAITYLAFAAALLGMGHHDVAAATPTRTRNDKGIRDVLRLVAGNKILLSTTIMYMSANIAMGMMFVWLPIYSDQGLGGGAGLFGMLLGLLAIGEVVSSLLAGSMSFRLALGSLICIVMLLSGLSVAILLLGEKVWIAAIGMTLFGFFSAPLTIWAQTLRMKIIPPDMMGRTFALLRMSMQGTNPLGGIVAGAALAVVSVPVMIGLSVVFVALPGAFGYKVKELRSAR